VLLANPTPGMFFEKSDHSGRKKSLSGKQIYDELHNFYKCDISDDEDEKSNSYFKNREQIQIARSARRS
jgi:hypothetical protein